MMSPGYQQIPDWYAPDNRGASIAAGSISGDHATDVVVIAVDGSVVPNRAAHRLGRGLDVNGRVAGGWSPWRDIPDWSAASTQGAGVAIADVSGSGRPDLVVLRVAGGGQPNSAAYRVGFDLDTSGAVTGGWSAWHDIPWFSWSNAGADIAVADLTGSGQLDVVVMTIDDPLDLNRGIYRVGRSLAADGSVSGGWSDWIDVPGWFSWRNQGAGVAVADTTGNGQLDIITFGIDDADQQNQAFYRIARDVNRDGRPALADPDQPQAGWSSLYGVNNWFSWTNQGGGITVADFDGAPHLVIAAADHPDQGSTGFITVVALTETPSTHGEWNVLSFNSQVLPIHTALLHTGEVLFFAGSGNNTARVADPDFGNIDAGLYTSVVWDPTATIGHNFDHPPTIRRADGRPFDFFCGGDTFLADGRILSAGGNQDYNNGNNLGQRDTAIFDPVSKQWTTTTPMAVGRWYPQLLTMPDGHILAVSGKNQFDGQLNTQFEFYDPASGEWLQHRPPDGPDFGGLPFYAHLFVMADGRVFFSGGRMDDDRVQRPGILTFTPDRVDFDTVDANVDGFLRNQSSSVLLPPAQQQRVMIVGGGPPDDRTAATGSTEIIDLTQPVPAFRKAMPLSLPRIHLNAVLLPDRTVFVSGGAIIHEESGLSPTARLQSELYDPSTDTWSPGATATVVRMYHSVALLMPTGEVMTASGNPPPYGHLPAWQPPQDNEELRIEMYRPPYLSRDDAPTIVASPTEWHYDQHVTVTTADSGAILWAELIKSGITTHAFDNSQRLVDLKFATTAPNELTITTPASPMLAPPGWYMLYLVSQQRTPSSAVWIHLT